MSDQPSRRIDQPEPCFVRMRLVKNGPYVAARIYLRLGILAAEINGEPAEVDRVWTSGELIDEARHNELLTTVIDPFQTVVVTRRGMADAIRKAEEADYWHTRPIV